jgi:hypothetical protein
MNSPKIDEVLVSEEDKAKFKKKLSSCFITNQFV